MPLDPRDRDTLRIFASGGVSAIPAARAAIGRLLSELDSLQSGGAERAEKVCPRLEWSGAPPSLTLSLMVGKLTVPVLMISTSPDMWWLSAGGTIHRERAPADVQAAAVAYVDSLDLPCPLPPFPGASDAS